MAAHVKTHEKAITEAGISTKPLYIKHLALSDWELIVKLQAALGNKSVADVVRHSIRRTAGLLGG